MVVPTPPRDTSTATATAIDVFCGAGGASTGIQAAGATVTWAADCWDTALTTHRENHPGATHWHGDARTITPHHIPGNPTIGWFSPPCQGYSVARARHHQEHATVDVPLPGLEAPAGAHDSSRDLMWTVPTILQAMADDGRPIAGGVVENVPETRDWAQWAAWHAAITRIGYSTRVIALNSAHAEPITSAPVPQRRDRLYLAYWPATGPAPQWGQWLRTTCLCPDCGPVRGIQAFRDPATDMGRWPAQYDYRCPTARCRGRVVTPVMTPLTAALDQTLTPGTPLGNRTRPLSEATRARIEDGLGRHGGRPFVIPQGARIQRKPLSWGPDAPAMTQTSRHEAALVTPGATWEEHRMRMLTPSEIGALMGMPAGYRVTGTVRDQIRQLGNAVTPATAEVLIRALLHSWTHTSTTGANHDHHRNHHH